MPGIVIMTTKQQTAAVYWLARSNEEDERRTDGRRKTMHYYVLKWMKLRNEENSEKAMALISIKEQMVSSKYPQESNSTHKSAECEAFSYNDMMRLPWVIFQSPELLVLTRENRRMNNRWLWKECIQMLFCCCRHQKQPPNSLSLSIITYFQMNYIFSNISTT